LEAYEEMFANQEGICAICGKDETDIGANSDKTRMLSIDHNHETGEIRGLLCNNCNRGLGGFLDNIESLYNAIEYLKKFQQ